MLSCEDTFSFGLHKELPPLSRHPVFLPDPPNYPSPKNPAPKTTVPDVPLPRPSFPVLLDILYRPAMSKHQVFSYVCFYGYRCWAQNKSPLIDQRQPPHTNF